jgi:hypothetical protein
VVLCIVIVYVCNTLEPFAFLTLHLFKGNLQKKAVVCSDTSYLDLLLLPPLGTRGHAGEVGKVLDLFRHWLS